MRTFTELRKSLRRNREPGLEPFAHRTWHFLFGGLRSWFIFRNVQHCGFGIRVRGRAPILRNEGTMELGDRVLFDAPVTPAYVEVEPGAVFRLGAESYINDGVWIGVTQLVSIGARVRIAPGVRIIDSAYHQVHDRRTRPPSQPVVIEDDVWISSDAMISPGVRLGRGAVVGAHALVTKDVAPFTVVAGVPARPISVVDRIAFERARSKTG